MRTVLYVEDGFDDRELMLHAVAKAKPRFELRLAEDYRGSVEYLSHRGFYENQEQFHLPDLVLLDYSLKGCSAPELLMWIRARPQTATLPVVILSGNTADHVVAECYARGANYFIEKPAHPDALLTLVRALDRCLSTSNVQLRPLEKFAVRPKLAQEHIKAALRASAAERARLMSERRELGQQLDLAMAEQKESRRKAKFIPPDQRKPRSPGSVREATAYIQNGKTGKFLTSDGKWIVDRHLAISFATAVEALAYCERNGLADCDILLDKGDPKLNIRLPYRPAS